MYLQLYIHKFQLAFKKNKFSTINLKIMITNNQVTNDIF